MPFTNYSAETQGQKDARNEEMRRNAQEYYATHPVPEGYVINLNLDGTVLQKIVVDTMNNNATIKHNP